MEIFILLEGYFSDRLASIWDFCFCLPLHTPAHWRTGTPAMPAISPTCTFSGLHVLLPILLHCHHGRLLLSCHHAFPRTFLLILFCCYHLEPTVGAWAAFFAVEQSHTYARLFCTLEDRTLFAPAPTTYFLPTCTAFPFWEMERKRESSF